MKKRMLSGFTGVIDVLTFILLVGVIVVSVLEVIILIRLFLAGDIAGAINAILYVIILLELYVILSDFIYDHHISVGKVVEIGIISLVRDVIFKFDKLEPITLFGIAAVLLALSISFWVGRKYKISLDPKS